MSHQMIENVRYDSASPPLSLPTHAPNMRSTREIDPHGAQAIVDTITRRDLGTVRTADQIAVERPNEGL